MPFELHPIRFCLANSCSSKSSSYQRRWILAQAGLHEYSEWDDQIVKKMQKRFAELCDVLMPLGDDEDDASGDEAESESKTDVPREWLDFTAKENYYEQIVDDLAKSGVYVAK